MKLKGEKVALVTGANRGIGYELVKLLSMKGFKVLLGSRDPEKGAKAAQMLKESGVDVSFVIIDVDNRDSIRQAAILVKEKFERLDVLINNAGVYLDENKNFLTTDPSVVEKTMLTNFFGVYYMMHYFIPFMEMQGFGRVINVSSEYGMMSQMSSQGAGAYKLSKFALNGLTRVAAADMNGDIKINAVDPGWVSTDMGGPFAPRTPSQAAESILWLATIGPDVPNGCFFRDGKRMDW